MGHTDTSTSIATSNTRDRQRKKVGKSTRRERKKNARARHLKTKSSVRKIWIDNAADGGTTKNKHKNDGNNAKFHAECIWELQCDRKGRTNKKYVLNLQHAILWLQRKCCLIAKKQQQKRATSDERTNEIDATIWIHTKWANRYWAWKVLLKLELNTFKNRVVCLWNLQQSTGRSKSHRHRHLITAENIYCCSPFWMRTKSIFDEKCWHRF